MVRDMVMAGLVDGTGSGASADGDAGADVVDVVDVVS